MTPPSPPPPPVPSPNQPDGVPPERLLDLLADRATQGLDEAEARELDRLLAENPDVDPASFDFACAAAYLAMNGPEVEEMPASLREKVARAARQRIGAQPVGVASGDGVAPERVPLRLPAPVRPSRGPVYAGWVVGAAGLALAAAGWWPWGGRGGGPAAEGERMLARAGVVRATWTVPQTGEAAPGEVVWDPVACCGVMRLDACLPVNDPRVEQYQVWIFDATRDERYPIHGGVFDVPRDGKVVVPIEPRLPVREAIRIAITVERPGGVWVSDRSRMPLVAKLKTE